MTVSRMTIVLLCAWLPLASSSRASAGDDAGFTDRVLPVLKTYCIDCHAGNEPEGSLSLETVNHASHVDDHPELWEDIAQKLRRHEMPPAESSQPTATERKHVDEWISQRLRQLAEKEKPNPGRVTMRRLNRAEYNNTIRDLVGIDFRPADDFPMDDTGYGFDNIGDVLSLSPLLVEKYLAAAQQIADKAIVESVPGETILSLSGSAMRHDIDHHVDVVGNTKLLLSNATLTAEVEIPATGSYQLVIRAFGKQAGSDPARMSVRVDGEEIRLIDVPDVEDRPGEYTLTWQLGESKHQIGLAFVNDYYRPDHSDPSQRDRNLTVVGLSIRKHPDAVWDEFPPTHRQLLLEPPTASNRRRLARKAIAQFAERAFRRPVNDEEIRRIYRLFKEAEGNGASFEQAMKVAMTAILVSPHFLFRVEPVSDGGNGGAQQLTDFQIASRLSYFLWSSMPDDALFETARSGSLHTPEVLARQANRMMDDPKASALTESFAVQWLQLRKLGMMSPDAEKFPHVDEALLADMRRETELFFAEIMRENRPITDLLDADFTYVNERLAKHYGMEGITGDEFRRVTLAGEERGGILTHASVLTLTSNPTRTSPVKRGTWVLQNILGTPSPPPPPGVPELPDENQAELVGTLRERLEQHRADNACGVCHNRIDPLGFALENYDAVGRWRTHDGEGEIDASGTLPDGTTLNGPVGLKKVLLARQDDFARCYIEKMLTYALGRGLSRSDRPAIDKIAEQSRADHYRFRTIVLAIVSSDPFLKRSTEDVP